MDDEREQEKLRNFASFSILYVEIYWILQKYNLSLSLSRFK